MHFIPLPRRAGLVHDTCVNGVLGSNKTSSWRIAKRRKSSRQSHSSHVPHRLRTYRLHSAAWEKGSPNLACRGCLSMLDKESAIISPGEGRYRLSQRKRRVK